MEIDLQAVDGLHKIEEPHKSSSDHRPITENNINDHYSQQDDELKSSTNNASPLDLELTLAAPNTKNDNNLRQQQNTLLVGPIITVT